ncbi:MAG: hypothetical protein EON54_15575 [Alcaligenaceae bacterium]|nr:MAG: hypothetical protein EON54_15575 [Alcaligenaceae bacterium]
MTETLDSLMRAYKETFAQEVRDLAETFCGATTRLGSATRIEARPLTPAITAAARARGISVETLAQAVEQYVRIEALAEAAHQRGL